MIGPSGIQQCPACGRYHMINDVCGCHHAKAVGHLPTFRIPVEVSPPAEFAHGAMWGVDVPDVAADPRAEETMDGVLMHVDDDGDLVVADATQCVWLCGPVALRLRDKLNACFPVGK